MKKKYRNSEMKTLRIFTLIFAICALSSIVAMAESIQVVASENLPLLKEMNKAVGYVC